MKLVDLKHLFLNDTLLLGDDQAEINKLKAFHSKAEGMTYILASRISGPEDFINHPASTFITNYLPDDHISGKNIIYNKNARLQMAKLSVAFDYEKQTLTHSVPRLHQSQSWLNISPSAHIDYDVEIGEGTKIYANVTIYKDVKIGKNCIIHSGAVIGTDGFGYEQEADGSRFKIAHLGGVIIGDNVEIGANTCIDRGTLSDTIIEDGVKIDNLVHIAHNVHIKKNVVIIANAMIAGSVIIGEGAWIAPSSSIREGKKIGDGALVGLGSVVIKDVPIGSTVMGVPAKEKI